MKTVKDIIKYLEEFSDKESLDDNSIVEFSSYVALSYKLFILNSFTIPLNKKSVYDADIARVVYDYSSKIFNHIKVKDGVHMLKEFQFNIAYLCDKLNNLVKPYSLQFRSLRLPHSVKTKIDNID